MVRFTTPPTSHLASRFSGWLVGLIVPIGQPGVEHPLLNGLINPLALVCPV
ncbi:MAG TPA: hypothetical protein VMI32_00525 [Candidatus Solibacter sp.]|nr:hypothetical protein [Candidatus Solibacter sp.]